MITCASCQELTLRGRVWLLHFNLRHLYVGASRATSLPQSDLRQLWRQPGADLGRKRPAFPSYAEKKGGIPFLRAPLAGVRGRFGAAPFPGRLPGPRSARSVIEGPSVTDDRLWVALYQSGTPSASLDRPPRRRILAVSLGQACPRRATSRRQRRRRDGDATATTTATTTTATTTEA